MTPQDAIKTFPEIHENSSGEYVKFLQAMLCSYSDQMRLSIKDSGKIDGDYGSGTKATVKMFQHDVNILLGYEKLEEDGICGRNTWNALADRTSRSSKPGSVGYCYQMNDPYAFSVSSVSVTTSTEWYYYDWFDSAVPFKSLGHLYK